MERNVYSALLGVAALGLLLNFEWLFLTFLLLAGGLFLTERFSSPAPSFQGAAWGPTEAGTAAGAIQQPIVIQSSAYIPANTMMMDMISNIVQESAYDKSPHSPFKKMQGSLDKKLSSLDKKLKHLHDIEHKLEHIENHLKHGHGGH